MAIYLILYMYVRARTCTKISRDELAPWVKIKLNLTPTTTTAYILFILISMSVYMCTRVCVYVCAFISFLLITTQDTCFPRTLFEQVFVATIFPFTPTPAAQLTPSVSHNSIHNINTFLLRNFGKKCII